MLIVVVIFDEKEGSIARRSDKDVMITRKFACNDITTAIIRYAKTFNENDFINDSVVIIN